MRLLWEGAQRLFLYMLFFSSFFFILRSSFEDISNLGTVSSPFTFLVLQDF